MLGVEVWLLELRQLVVAVAVAGRHFARGLEGTGAGIAGESAVGTAAVACSGLVVIGHLPLLPVPVPLPALAVVASVGAGMPQEKVEQENRGLSSQ